MLIPTDQDTIRLVLARGGTSKGLYLHAQDIPPPGPERDALLCRLMGSPADDIELESGATVRVSIVDAGNITCWVTAGDIGLTGSEQADEIEDNEEVMSTFFEIRAKAAALAGLVDDWTQANEPDHGLPLTGAVAAPGDYVAANSDQIASDTMDLRVRLIFLDRLHPTIAGSGSIGLTAASRIPGSVVEQASAATADSGRCVSGIRAE